MHRRLEGDKDAAVGVIALTGRVGGGRMLLWVEMPRPDDVEHESGRGQRAANAVKEWQVSGTGTPRAFVGCAG